MTCARCSFPAIDYCAFCKDRLCDDCVSRGCCGQSPAESGVEQHYQDTAEIREARYGDLGLPREDVA